MCLVFYEAPTEQTAKNDMVVYKRVKRDWANWANEYIPISEIMYFPYLLGKLYRLRKKLKVETYRPPDDNIYQIFQGFHSYKSIPEYNSSYDGYRYRVNMKCIIPKGAKYYINHDDEIVSTSIKLVEWI